MFVFPALVVMGKGVQCPVPPTLGMRLYGGGISCAIAPVSNVVFQLVRVDSPLITSANVNIVYQLQRCVSDSDCGVGGACSAGECRCGVNLCGTLCDTSTANPSGFICPQLPPVRCGVRVYVFMMRCTRAVGRNSRHRLRVAATR
jgi:hypothetical protein